MSCARPVWPSNPIQTLVTDIMFQFLRDLLDRCLCLPPNPEVPPGDSAMVFRASPAFFRYRMVLLAVPILLLGAFPGIVLVPLFASIFSGNEVGREPSMLPMIILGGMWVGALLAFLAITTILVRLDYEKRWYMLTDRSLRVREGVMAVRETTVTYANIQNIAIEQGPLQRLFNIADLKVDTAGGGGGGGGGTVTIHGKHASAGTSMHCARFRGVENAGAIKELMQNRLYGTRDAGLGDTDEPVAPVLLVHGDAGLAAVLEEMLAEARALRQAAARI